MTGAQGSEWSIIPRSPFVVPLYNYFNDVLDYVWKSPTFISDEKKRELRKLEEYFPYTGDNDKDFRARALRNRRWAMEGPKIDVVFQRFMNDSNLIAAVSLYEHNILYFSKIAEAKTGVPCRAAGIRHLYAYLESLGVDPRAVPLYDQVDAAILMRNCLAHANGLLAWHKQSERLEEIIKKSSYQPPYRQEVSDYGAIKIEKSPLGRRIIVPSEYVYIATAMLRDHMAGVGEMMTDRLFRGATSGGS